MQGKRGAVNDSVTFQEWYIAAGSSDSIVTLLDMRKFDRALRRLHGHQAPITCVAVTPDEAALLSTSTDGKLLVHDVLQQSENDNGEQQAIHGIGITKRGAVNGLKIVPEKMMAIAAGDDGDAMIIKFGATC